MSPLFFYNNYELKFDIVDTNVESLEPIQLDITGVSSAIPSLQMEIIMEKVLRSSRRSFHHKLTQSS